MQTGTDLIAAARIAVAGVALTPVRSGSRWSERDRRAGDIVARVAAAAAAGLSPDRVVVLRRPGAPPLALAAGRRRRLHISLSLTHRLGRALAAAAPAGTRVGIDLEREGVVPAGAERLFMADAERPLLDRHDAAAIWALKEAAWKALALPAWLPFSALRLRVDADGDVVAVETPDVREAARATLWSPWPRFVAALVWTMPEAA
ncbi:MAG: 4'-phosphopantetheinyl transferase family protein [Longimicrobiales bacterium]